MTGTLLQVKIKKITSLNGEFICFLQEEHQRVQNPGEYQKVNLYRFVNNDLIHQRELFGDGVFIDNANILLFIDNSGYGPCEGDCYIYNIVLDKISPLYDDDFQSLCEDRISSRGSFVSLSANILVTPNFLILKTGVDEICFYSRHSILESKKMEIIYRLPLQTDEEKPIDELLGFDEQTSMLEYASGGIITRKVIDFQQVHPTNPETIGLNLSNDLYEGCAMDFNTLLSLIKPDGTIEVKKTELSNSLYKLKYENQLSEADKIAQKAFREHFYKTTESTVCFFQNNNLCTFYGGAAIDILIPIPSSNPNEKDPLEDLWLKFSQLTKIPVDTSYLIKTAATTQIKSIDDNKKRENILKNSLSITDNRYQGKTVLLLDDTYRSGATLKIAATLLKEKGGVTNVCALTIVKIRTGSNIHI